MGNIAYFPLEDDWFEDLGAAAITVLTEDANYPKTKLQSIEMADTARATDPGGGVKIRFDLGSNRIPGYVALLNHNILIGSPILRSYNDAYTTLSGESQLITFRKYDMDLKYMLWTAKRYWEIIFSNCTFVSPMEWGKLIVGASITVFTKNFSPGVDRGHESKNIYNETSFGVAWVYLIQEKINHIGFKWDPHLKTPLIPELIDFMESNHGGGYPVIIIPDRDATEFYYCRCQDLASWNEAMARGLISGLNLSFKELSRGKVQT